MARKTAGIHDDKMQFVNQTDGFLGVVTYAPNGDEKSIAVEPGGTVWLSAAEQELTAKAPAKAADNPFIEHQVPVRDPDTGDITEYAPLIPLAPVQEERPTPATRRAQRGDAPDGSHDGREEVGTPSAQSPPARQRRRSTSKAKTAAAK